MNEQHEEKTVSAYIKFLQGKNIGEDALALRTKFIKKLCIFLKGKSGRDEYGQALQTVLGIEHNIERNQQMNIAREFFPFWMDDIKLIAAMSESYGYDLSATKFKPIPKPLEWKNIEVLNSEKLDERESALLSHYSMGLQKQNLMKDAIEAKLKLVKVMLLRLRDIPIKNNLAYRMAIDVTLPLFNLDDLRQKFLQAVREFFYIWIEKPGMTAKPA